MRLSDSIKIPALEKVQIELTPAILDIAKKDNWTAQDAKDVLMYIHRAVLPSEDVGNGYIYRGKNECENYVYEKDGKNFIVDVEKWDDTKMIYSHAMLKKNQEFLKNTFKLGSQNPIKTVGTDL